MDVVVKEGEKLLFIQQETNINFVSNLKGFPKFLSTIVDKF